MTRVDEFDSFFRTAFEGVLHVTYASCGDRQVALEATTDAFRRAWRDWAKIRDRAPLGYVRNEAWKATTLNRTAHPLRRRHEEDSDESLLEALGDLPVDQRRLLVLMTLGNTDLEAASREVGLRAEDGIEQATDALGQLEKATGNSIGEIEDRLDALTAVTANLAVPDPSTIRKAARRGTQRNTVLLVATAVLAVLGAGFAVTEGDGLDRQDALPKREKFGAESTDIVLDARKVTENDLLSGEQVSRLDPAATWKVDGTDGDPTNTTPFATCPTQRFADPDPLRVFVRTFSSEAGNARVAQAIEISRTPEQAAAAARQIVGWYANCAHPRVQLISASTVKRAFGDFTILQLRSHREPQRIFTVGFANSGAITSTVVHEVDGTTGPSLDEFARVLNDSVSSVCRASGGRCASDDLQVIPADPPRTADSPNFLAVVDLPPITDVNRVWASVPARPDPNLAATPCDEAQFDSKSIQKAESRVYVLYQAEEVPDEFAITETVGRFKSEDAAKKFIDRMTDRIDDCPDDNLTASLDDEAKIGDPTIGNVWRIALEAGDDTVHYRTGFVRRGASVAQVTMVPFRGYDVSKNVFRGLVTRASIRLKQAEAPTP